MDTDWVLTKIDEFVGLIETDRGISDVSKKFEMDDKIKALLPTMEQIATVVEPGRPHQWHSNSDYSIRWWVARDTALRLRAIVTTQAEVAAKLGPTGPQLAAAGLHPGVCGAAAKLWDDGHVREAVQTAATYVENALKAKIDRRGGRDGALAPYCLPCRPRLRERHRERRPSRVGIPPSGRSLGVRVAACAGSSNPLTRSRVRSPLPARVVRGARA